VAGLKAVQIAERRLFSWDRWRASIIRQWANLDRKLDRLSREELKDVARGALRELTIPCSPQMELYWICCAASDYSINYEPSFDNIRIPRWLPLPWDESLGDSYTGQRVLPPLSIRSVLTNPRPDFTSYRFMRKVTKIGAPPKYSDRLAVKCAALRDGFGKTYVEVAEEMALPVRKYFFTRQSDIARRLVNRGRRLLHWAEIACFSSVDSY
jgi:hypothetical protein